MVQEEFVHLVQGQPRPPLIGDGKDQIIVPVRPGDHRPAGLRLREGPLLRRQHLRAPQHGACVPEAPGLGGIRREHLLRALPGIHMQPVRLQREPAVGELLQIPEHLSVRHRQGAPGGIKVILHRPGIVLRHIRIHRAPVAAAVDRQRRPRDGRRHLPRQFDVLLPFRGRLADLPGRILHPHLGQIAAAALHRKGFDPVLQGFRIIAAVGPVGKVILPGREGLRRRGLLPQGRQRQPQQAQQQPKDYSHARFPPFMLRRASAPGAPAAFLRPGRAFPRERPPGQPCSSRVRIASAQMAHSILFRNSSHPVR